MNIQKKDFERPFPFELYLPEGNGRFPLICITPILGRIAFLDDLFLERPLARFFASQGFASALIKRPFFEFDPSRGLEQVEEYLVVSIERNRSVLDFLLTQKEIDPARIGTYGMSFGGVVNSLWANSDSRLKAHVFSLIGGNIAEIILTSRDPLVKAYAKAIKNSRGAPAIDSDLLADLQKTIQSDLLKVSCSIPRENILMFLGIFDHVIRLRYGLAAWHALGKPEVVFIPLGHYASILTIPIFKWKAIKFFKQKLS